jgi:hypothetical protein
MGFWKILGGVAIGVGAVAAAPFTGGGSVLGAATLLGSMAGAGTVAAAVAAGTAGAVAGAVLSDQEKEERQNETRRAKEAGVAAGAKLAEDQWKEKFITLCSKLKERENFENTLIGLMAVGLAVANADGEICDEERFELDDLISGISSSSLPSSIKETILQMRNDPPNFNQAMAIARKYGCNVEDIDVVIEVMANADDVITPEEDAFISKWNSEMRPQMIQ